MSAPSPQQLLQLAVQHHQAGRLAEAEPLYRQVLAQFPDQPDATYLLGLVLGQQGKLADAIALLEKALAVRPPNPSAFNNLGEFYRRSGNLAAAVANFQKALALNPNYPEAHMNLGHALKDQGNPAQAAACYRRVIALRPKTVDPYLNLAYALSEMLQFDEAIAVCKNALAIKPDFPEAYLAMGNAFGGKNQHDQAVAAYRQALAINPGYAKAYNNLGNALLGVGQAQQATAAYQQALAIDPKSANTHSNLIFSLYYHAADAHHILERSKEWDARHAAPLRPLLRPHSNPADPEKPLHVGYVSPDFHQHSVAFFFLPLLENHDASRFRTFCYYNNTINDPLTARIRKAAPVFRDIARLSDDQVAEMIRQDGIDILVDLSGHSAAGRLLVFARKPAPLQTTWLGFPGTTGMQAMDYRVSDALADPPGESEAFCTEKIVRLSHTAWCFAPLSGSPPIAPPPATNNGCVTFGTFNNFAKGSPQVLELWAQILLHVQNSRLILKSGAMSSPQVIAQLQAFFASRSVSASRLEFLPKIQAVEAHLEAYNRVDIALDTFPYHGTTTTCEAMWMGVPVVTLAGQSHVSRVGVSLLTSAGIPELIARSPEQYVALATQLGGDLPRLTALRQSLRPAMQRSPLLDAPLFARDMESALRSLWREYCNARAKVNTELITYIALLCLFASRCTL